MALLANPRHRNVGFRVWLLLLLLAAVCATVVPLAISLGGWMALAAAGLAAGLCFVGAAAGLLAGDWLRRSGQDFIALWLGAALRIIIPFTFGIPIHLHGGPLARAGLLWYLLLFYLVALATGTWLALPPTNRDTMRDPRSPP